MPASVITRDEAIDRLTVVFRRNGYEGASLARLAKAAGVKTASLYYHFPGGKQEMAMAVLQRANEWLETVSLAPLSSGAPPRERLEAMCAALVRYYGSGRNSCLLGLLSQGDARDLFGDHVEAALDQWIAKSAATLAEAGLPKAVAARRAEDAVIAIQGALVVSRGTNATAPFERTIEELPDRLLAPA